MLLLLSLVLRKNWIVIEALGLRPDHDENEEHWDVAYVKAGVVSSPAHRLITYLSVFTLAMKRNIPHDGSPPKNSSPPPKKIRTLGSLVPGSSFADVLVGMDELHASK
jgi:hypothetical protein